jgi:hypothetical protein
VVAKGHLELSTLCDLSVLTALDVAAALVGKACFFATARELVAEHDSFLAR